MKRQKKQYRPIAGQRWYEKILDWITREENFRWCIVGIVSYVVLLAVGGDISANVMNRPDIADIFMNLWFHFLPVVAVLVMINPLSDI
jgi:hypothetical protein